MVHNGQPVMDHRGKVTMCNLWSSKNNTFYMSASLPLAQSLRDLSMNIHKHAFNM